MVNISNITQPVTGQENASRIRPQTSGEELTGVYQAPDPSRVHKTQDQNVYADRQNNPFSPNLGSNFDKFLQSVRNTPELAKLFGDVFYSKLGNLVNSGMEEGLTAEIAQYMEMLNMTDAQLLEMLKNQQGASVKFSGPFFDILRQLMQGNGSQGLKGSILDFLRKYDSMSSGDHILKNIVSNLLSISRSMPKSSANQLTELLQQLRMNLSPGDNHENLSVLKNSIMPFLSSYVSQTKDFGSVRDFITMLTLNIARYESGSTESFQEALRDLLSYGEVSRYLKDVSAEELSARLMANQGNVDPLADRLAHIISRGVAGDAGYQNKAVFENMMSSILLNESVYMPLIHMTLPGCINGRQFFSEMWVDPNDKSGKGQGEGRAVKLLIKFDIRDLGYFEMVILAQDGQVDMELYRPKNLPATDLEIKTALKEIMEKNDLSFRSVMIAKCEAPKTISEVFPKLYEGRNSINVAI